MHTCIHACMYMHAEVCLTCRQALLPKLSSRPWFSWHQLLLTYPVAVAFHHTQIFFPASPSKKKKGRQLFAQTTRKRQHQLCSNRHGLLTDNSCKNTRINTRHFLLMACYGLQWMKMGLGAHCVACTSWL